MRLSSGSDLRQWGRIDQSRPQGGVRAAGGKRSSGSGRPPGVPRGAASHLHPLLRPQMLLRHWRNSVQELCSHEVFLTKLNWELVKAIQDMEESSALKAHAMLQQQDLLAVRPRPHPLASAPRTSVRSRRRPAAR